MAKTPESTFRNYLNKKLHSSVYYEGISNQFRGGTPDNYYEKDKILWVEYKFERRVPGIYRLSRHVSPLQHHWLDRCDKNGQQCAVIVGFGFEHVIIVEHGDWHKDYTREEILAMAMTRAEAIEWIQNKVTLIKEGRHEQSNISNNTKTQKGA